MTDTKAQGLSDPANLPRDASSYVCVFKWAAPVVGSSVRVRAGSGPQLQRGAVRGEPHLPPRHPPRRTGLTRLAGLQGISFIYA